MESCRGNLQVEAVNIFSLNSHITGKAVTCEERVISRNTHTQLPNVESCKGYPQVEAVNIFLLNSHATSKTIICTERVIRRNIHTQLPDERSYRNNPQTEAVNIFSLKVTRHKQVSYLCEASYKENHTQLPIHLLHRTVQNQTVGNLLPIFFSFVGFLSFLTSFPQSRE